MTAELLKSIEQMDDAEKEALADALFGNVWYTDVFDPHHEAGLAVRANVEAGHEHFTRDDVIAVLNMDEVGRQLSHLLFSMVAKNLDRVRSNLTSARCCYCAWEYRDESWDWPADREVSDDDLATLDARIKAQIREHVATCPDHPMRYLEREVAELREHDTRF